MLVNIDQVLFVFKRRYRAAKLILCLATEVPVYLFDEPCSNLDESGINWYQEKLESLPEDKTIVIASNQSYEYPGFTDEINILNYKWFIV